MSPVTFFSQQPALCLGSILSVTVAAAISSPLCPNVVASHRNRRAQLCAIGPSQRVVFFYRLLQTPKNPVPFSTSRVNHLLQWPVPNSRLFMEPPNYSEKKCHIRRIFSFLDCAYTSFMQTSSTVRTQKSRTCWVADAAVSCYVRREGSENRLLSLHIDCHSCATGLPLRHFTKELRRDVLFG